MTNDRLATYAYAGLTGVLKGDTLPVAVVVQSAHLAYGVLRFVVFNELGSATVNADRVELK